jgi:hypothetical protein
MIKIICFPTFPVNIFYAFDTPVILFDPIFQGLAISLMAGEVASTLFSRMVVPILYYLNRKRVEGQVR